MTAEQTPVPAWVVAHSQASPVVIHVPHGGTTIPDRVRRRIVLGDDELVTELRRMTDWYTDVIADLIRVRCDPPTRPTVFTNRLSRLVVDPERFPDDREIMRSVGMGAVYTRTHHGRPLRRLAGEEELELLATYFHPYAEALADLVDETIARHGRCTIVDLHSYPQHPLPYELNPTAARPAVCIGTDDLHTPSSLAAAARSAFADVEVCENTPFAGTYVPLRHYGTDLRVSSVMIEIRRDLYLDEASGAPIAPGVHAMADAVSNLVRIAGTV